MHSIGKKLTEAREAAGLTLAAASTATKIREDYLEHMENNAFDAIPLPKVYIHGFLTLYARHVNLDPQTIIAEYHAMQLGDSGKKHQLERESLGYLDISDGEPNAASAAPLAAQADDAEGHAEDPEPGQPQEQNYANNKKPFPSTIPATTTVIVGALAVTVILIILLARVFAPDDGRESATASSAAPGANEQTANPSMQEQVLFLAKGNLALKVTQLADNKLLFSDYLKQGEEIMVEKRGEVLVAFTEGKNLIIQRGGRQTEIPIEGPGRVSIP